MNSSALSLPPQDQHSDPSCSVHMVPGCVKHTPSRVGGSPHYLILPSGPTYILPPSARSLFTILLISSLSYTSLPRSEDSHLLAKILNTHPPSSRPTPIFKSPSRLPPALSCISAAGSSTCSLTSFPVLFICVLAHAGHLDTDMKSDLNMQPQCQCFSMLGPFSVNVLKEDICTCEIFV